MKADPRKAAAFLLLFCLLGFFLCCTGCAEPKLPPELFRDAEITAGNTVGRLEGRVFTIERPENLSGMEVTAAGSIVSVRFGELTKSSDTAPGILELFPARLMLLLEELSQSQMSLRGVSEGRAEYSASVSRGEWLIYADSQGQVYALKNADTGEKIVFSPLLSGGGPERPEE